jgi:haloalkane dehalogenase
VQDIPLSAKDPSYAICKEVEDHQEERLGHLPLMLGWGEKDFVFDLDFLAEWERRYPNAEVHRFPDAGHYVLEDAKDELIPLIEEFLQRTK